MATALELASDIKHPELDEKASHDRSFAPSPTHSGSGRLPSMQEYMEAAAITRAREASGDSRGESPSEKPDIKDDLILAQRALRTASWASVFYLITTDILGPFNAPYAFSQVGYVPGAILYLVSEYITVPRIFL